VNKFKKFLVDYSSVVFITIFFNVIIRIAEYIYLLQVKYEEVNYELLFSKSLNYDSLFILLFSLVFLAPSFFLYLISPQLGKLFVRTLFLFLIVSFLVFTEYFLINNSLLSSSLFEFSIQETLGIVLTELSLNRIYFTSFIIIITLCISIVFTKLYSSSIIKKANFLLYLYLALGVVASFNYKHMFKPLVFFSSYNHFLIGNSKPVFFLKSYFESLEVNDFYSQQEIKEQIALFQDYYKDEKKFVNLNLPLINESYYPNVLGSCFKEIDTKPNIVIIVSESLSASFSGNSLSIKKSLTPFTDSLSNIGLSWDNFFSNAERSYGVLPNLLSSLLRGAGARGFINMKQDTSSNSRFAKHNSLIQILNSNEYVTSYFYGGSGHFDNVDQFVDQSLIDNRITLSKFDTTKYFRFKRKNSEAVWGFNDKDLYSQGIDIMKGFTANRPYLSVFQTLSNHSPYNLSDDRYYEQNYLKHKLQSLGLTFDDVQKIEKKILASIFYADDALKELFLEIKKRRDFENTIFIITGDHAVNLNLNKNVFESYSVPLIIYSPLLKKTKRFKGVCSHIDVLPSLLSLLKNNYNLSVPLKNHWLGTGLDTNSVFTANRFTPLNLKSMEIPNAIIGNKVLLDNVVYQFDESLQISKVKDSSVSIEFMKRYNNYKVINKFAVSNNLIWKEQ